MSHKNLLTTAIVPMVAMLVGCMPERFDPTLVNRYQQAMAGRGPQARVGTEGLGQLGPAPGTTGPQLKMEEVKDEAGKVLRTRIPLSLEEAVMRVVANSMDIRVISYDPAISREEMMKAAAAFDLAVFGAMNYKKDDKMTSTAFLASQSQVNTYQAGVKEHALTGADWSLAWTLTRTADNSVFSSLPIRFEPTINFSVTQPLLRNAWPEFNLAKLRIATINNQVTQAQFRAEVEKVITDAVSTYWALWQARQDVEILRRLLKEGSDIRDIVSQQRDKGTASDLQVEQVESTVKAREAAVVRARKAVLDQRDKLARLMADAQVNLLNDYEIDPITPPLEEQIALEATDQLLTALQYNPLLEQARLGIAMADVNVRVAGNQTLPKLDLTASTELQGLGETSHAAKDIMWKGDFVSYSLGLMLEYPLGNREALAELRRTQLAKGKAIADMQNAADQLALTIRERIRQVHNSYDELRVQKESSRVAKAYVDKWKVRISREVGESMKPELLSVLLNAQEAEAAAARAVLETKVSYNTALVDVAQAAGTVLELSRVHIAAFSDQAGWPAPVPPWSARDIRGGKRVPPATVPTRPASSTSSP